MAVTLTSSLCLTNVLEIFEAWTSALDGKHGIDIVYLDYLIDFNTISHKRLLEKIKRMGIAGDILTKFEDFLTLSKNRVRALF